MHLNLAAAWAAALVLVPLPASAAATCAYDNVERLARDVAGHFQARTLNDLGRRLPARRAVLRIKHSIEDGLDLTDRIAVAGLEARLAAAEKAEPRQAAPQRQILEGLECRGLSCRFGPSGILHNNLYLQQLTFVRSQGCLTLAGIDLLDGD
jgi:hypothetical protein